MEHCDAAEHELESILSDRQLIVASQRARAAGDPSRLDVYRTLGERGLLAPHWPERYGGRNLPMSIKAKLTRGLILHEHPDLAHVVSIDIVGQTILDYGSDALKDKYLPGLASGHLLASVLYTEPNAGSDMASLQTRAEPVHGGWSLYGRKIYSLKSHSADLAIVAARTSDGVSKMHGITLFVVPLNSSGLYIEPVESISDDAFSDVLLDGVLVTQRDVLGGVDEGWDLVGQILPIERTGVEFETKCRLLLDHLKATSHLGSDPRLGEFELRHSACHDFATRNLEDVARGAASELDTAVSKLAASELHRDITLYVCTAVGAEQLDPSSVSMFDREHRDTPGYTLSAGTSEMMLQIILSHLLSDSMGD